MTVGRAAVREEPRPWWGEVRGSGGEHPGEVGGGGARREGHVAEHQISRAAGLGAVRCLSRRGATTRRCPASETLLCSPLHLLHCAGSCALKQRVGDVTKGTDKLTPVPVCTQYCNIIILSISKKYGFAVVVFFSTVK